MVGEFNPWHVVLILFGVAAAVLWAAALVSIARARALSGAERVMWIVVVLILPLLGSIVWFALGRPRRELNP